MNKFDETQVDDVLQDYFKSEMPHPWPAFQPPMQTRTKEPRSFWSRSGVRLAVAASLASLLAAYLSLAGYFPGMSPATNVQPELREIGGGPKEKRNAPRTLPKIDDDPMPTPMQIDGTGR